jgi:hypothetical protein
MPYFHATAVFEARGTSLEEADRTAAALFKSLRHNRIHYHEHDVTAGAGPSPSSKNLYFSVIAEFDVDAYNEDRAGEFTEEMLDHLATDDVQFIAFGLTQGEQRVRPAQRSPQPSQKAEPAPEPAAEAPSEPPQETRQETRAEPSEPEERKGKKRSSRGRGRGKRKGDRDVEGAREEQQDGGAEVAAAEEERGEAPAERPATLTIEPLAPVVTAPSETEPKPALEIRPLVLEEEAPPAPPPPRSSSAMHITLTMSFRASEFGLRPSNGEMLDQEEFLARATAEARRRHPELPSEVEPSHTFSSLPWGDVIANLTWTYPVPVPSAQDEPAPEEVES